MMGNALTEAPMIASTAKPLETALPKKQPPFYYGIQLQYKGRPPHSSTPKLPLIPQET